MIKKISIKNFRCHIFFEENIHQSFVYIDGDNGSGKTSILESMYFISTSKSHRTHDEKEIIKKNEMFSHIKIVTDTDRFEMIISKQGKRAFINGVEKKKMSDFIGSFKVVMFAPEDLNLIKGSPTERRQFIDLSWMQLNKSYITFLNQYKNVLKQRNSLLKKININDDLTFVDILGEQLYEVGIKIIQERRYFIEQLNFHLNTIYKKFSNHQIKMIYQPHVDENQFKKHIEKQQKQDILYQTTQAGPHKDDFFIDFNGFDSKAYASQGEQRLIVIAVKFALLNLIKTMTNQQVTLLLDDVLSELDQTKQNIFLKELPKEHQIIMNSAIPIIEKGIQKIHLKKE